MRKHNTKKILGILLLAILMVTIALIQVAAMNTSPASSAAVDDIFNVGDLNYKITSINPAEVAVTGLADPALTEITIPNEVTNDATTYSVTSIGSRAFLNKTVLTSVTIENTTSKPSRLTTIASLAFRGSGITSIAIPQSVVTIEASAFASCLSLTSVTIENTEALSKLATIGDNAFQQSKIASIAIPQNVTSIGKYAFDNCTLLATVTIENSADTQSQLTSIGLRAFHMSGITAIVIPQSMIKIENEAFLKCDSLAKVEITSTEKKPSNLETIGDYAFMQSKITSIIIPQNVMTIGFSAFADCTFLTSVEIENTKNVPSKLEKIGGNAFQRCNITTLFIPQSVTAIDKSAFYQCADLSVLVFSRATVPTFGAELFATAGKDIRAYVPWAPKADYKTAFEAGTVLSGYDHTLTVLGYGELVMPANALIDAPIWEAGYSQSIVATDGIEKETVTYEITGGALPDGLSMDANGNITGTPTKVGKSTFTVTATVANAVAQLEYSAEKEYTINVTDTIAPVITVEKETVDIEINGNISEADFLKLVGVGATDNSLVTPTITTDFDTVDQGILKDGLVVTITATDGSGNFSTKEITVNVTDTIAPVITVEKETVDIEINGNITEADFLKLVGVGATDNSNGVVTITTDFDKVVQNTLGEKVVTITATDESGNFSTTTVTVNVVDTTPEPTTVTEETTTEVVTTEDSGTDVETGDTFTTSLFFIIALFSVLFILTSRKKEEELQS